VPINKKDMRDKTVDFLVNNIDHFNVTTICKWCLIERSRMQRCITGTNEFKDSEIVKINTYFKAINNAVSQVCNEG
jgi:hypothetical protein